MKETKLIIFKDFLKDDLVRTMVVVVGALSIGVVVYGVMKWMGVL